MAGPLQVGDIINLGRLAWDIYRFGWSDDLNASKCHIFAFHSSHMRLSRKALWERSSSATSLRSRTGLGVGELFQRLGSCSISSEL